MLGYPIHHLLQHRSVLEITSGKNFLIGQQLENPLLLLGQYSDDEVDVQSNERLDVAAADSSLDANNEVKDSASEECIEMEVNAGVDLAAQTVGKQDKENSASQDAFQNCDGNDAGDIDATAAGQLCNEMDSAEQVSVPGTSDLEVTVDAHTGWKMVLHDESNQYYYWNTETGETSWEVPEILAKATDLTNGQRTLPVTEGRETALLESHDSSYESVKGHGSSDIRINDAPGVANLGAEAKELYEHGPQIYEWNEAYKDGSLDAKSCGAELGQKDSSHGPVAGTETDKYVHERFADGEHGTGVDISSGLIEHGECLLERLNLLKRSEGHLQGHDWVSKYIMEFEVRLSDVRALLSYGSLLLPFWVYSERRFKQLEDAINDEINQSAKKMNVVETHDASVIREDDKLVDNMRHEEGVHGHFNGVAFFSEHSVPSSIVTSIVAEMDRSNNALNNDIIIAEHVSSPGHPAAHVDDSAGNFYEKNSGAAGLPSESSPKSTFHAGEDVDMDVDMEVEDAIPTNNDTIQDTFNAEHFALVQESVQPNTPIRYPCPTTEDGLVAPLPPDEEWIPPPPPDYELVPPPPPDEPPEPSCPLPPSYSVTVQPFTYTEPYQLSYRNSNFEFYGQPVAEVPSSNICGHVEGHQVAVPHQPLYYEVVPNTYTDTAPVIVNHADSAAYYNIEDGTVPPVPALAIAESSGFHAESGPLIYSGLPTSQSGSIDVIPDANMKADYSAFGTGTCMESLDVPITSTSAVATTSLKESVLDTSAAAIDGASTTAKIGSKVSRSKKRTVAVASTLRSNKKVSKLVDKWKAAKEELHEDDEDEPENAYDVLEKKRQREIEEWHAQQIASGDARDNANFQPLGGNWRERVKRRRAARERVRSPSEVVADGNKQPTLKELSRDLPSGWQAFWDEASKQVYYGNATTSETTWTKPTK